jgi:hypothetical protein
MKYITWAKGITMVNVDDCSGAPPLYVSRPEFSDVSSSVFSNFGATSAMRVFQFWAGILALAERVVAEAPAETSWTYRAPQTLEMKTSLIRLLGAVGAIRTEKAFPNPKTHLQSSALCDEFRAAHERM